MTADPHARTTASDALERLKCAPSPLQRRGRVVRAYGTSVVVSGLTAAIGQRCEIVSPDGSSRRLADVVGMEAGQLILYPLGTLDGISTDSRVYLHASDRTLAFSERLLGCVLDGTGTVIQGSPVDTDGVRVPVTREAPPALQRQPIRQPFETGIRAIDALLGIGIGQRTGIYAGAGGGKSTLLAMLARHAAADVIVIGLIGERGREIREFLEDHLGEDGRAKSVVVTATSDRPAMERIMAAHCATAIAEAFRERGRHVLLLLDSVTRYARALREIGLSIGEPPVRRGFPPSVFAELPRLFERAGNDQHGSMTAFYTVLLEDDDGNDPIAEETRSILDGHIMLSRPLGESGHYPAIDVLASTSRLFTTVADAAHQAAALQVRRLMARYRDVDLLLKLGEYEPGVDAETDEAIERQPGILALLRQASTEHVTRDAAIGQLLALVASGDQTAIQPGRPSGRQSGSQADA